MNTNIDLEELLKQEIYMVVINRLLHRFKDNETLVDFTVWLKPNKLDLKGYKIQLPYNKALKYLGSLLRICSLSNYRLFELKEQTILSGLYMDNSFPVDGVIQEEVPLQIIEFKLPEKGFYKQLLELLEKGAEIYDEEFDNYFPLTNLVFNRNNLNISVRCHDNKQGFKTKYLLSYGTSKIRVRSKEPLLVCDVVQVDKTNEDYLVYDVHLDNTQPEPHTLFVNGVEVNTLYTIHFLSRELYLTLLNRQFDLQVATTVINTVAAKLFEPEVNKSREYSSSSSHATVKTIKVAPVYQIPSTVDLGKWLHSPTDIQDLANWLNLIKQMYGHRIYCIAYDTVKSMEVHAKKNIPLRVMFLQKSLQKQFAIEGLQAHAVKNLLSHNRVFTQLNLGKGTEVQSAVCTYASLFIETYLREVM